MTEGGGACQIGVESASRETMSARRRRRARRWRPQMTLALVGEDGVLNAGGARDLISQRGLIYLLISRSRPVLSTGGALPL